MKTIVHIESKKSKYIFADDVEITMESDRIITPNFIIGDLNSENSSLFESVTPPEDWFGNKYFYENEQWVLDEEWEDWRQIEDEDTPSNA